MTSRDHESGTDRVAEAAADLPGEIVVNVQGDEPELDPDHLDRLIGAVEDDEGCGLATLAAPIEKADLPDPNVVKVVIDTCGRALYFSRAPIPHERRSGQAVALRHAGVYAFRRGVLARFVDIPPTPLERAESLEQLRAIESGIPIRVVVVDRVAPGIDTPGDYAAFLARLERSRGKQDR